MNFDYMEEAKLNFNCNQFLSHVALVSHRDRFMGREAASLRVFCDGFDKNDPEVLYKLKPAALPPYRRALLKDMRRDAGGYISHRAFFNSISSHAPMPCIVAERLQKDFNSLENFTYKFVSAAAEENTQGFLWVGEEKMRRGKLKIIFAPENRLPPDFKGLLCLDLWEHSYYETYGTQKDAYATAFLSVCRWDNLCK